MLLSDKWKMVFENEDNMIHIENVEENDNDSDSAVDELVSIHDRVVVENSRINNLNGFNIIIINNDNSKNVSQQEALSDVKNEDIHNFREEYFESVDYVNSLETKGKMIF